MPLQLFLVVVILQEQLPVLGLLALPPLVTLESVHPCLPLLPWLLWCAEPLQICVSISTPKFLASPGLLCWLVLAEHHQHSFSRQHDRADCRLLPAPRAGGLPAGRCPAVLWYSKLQQCCRVDGALPISCRVRPAPAMEALRVCGRHPLQQEVLPGVSTAQPEPRQRRRSRAAQLRRHPLPAAAAVP